MSFDPLFTRFVDGFRQFHATWYEGGHNLYKELRAGQKPVAVVVACSDSRVDPVQILNARPGELFVIRNVANLVPPHEPDTHHHGVSSALEYAIRHLRVRHIIVMGHAHCGGFANLLGGGHEQDVFLNVWLDQAQLAKREAERLPPSVGPEARQRACEMNGVRISLRNLRTFPWIEQALAKNRLHLHGLYFDMIAGELLCLDPESDMFIPLEETLRGARVVADEG